MVTEKVGNHDNFQFETGEMAEMALENWGGNLSVGPMNEILHAMDSSGGGGEGESCKK